MIPEGKQPSVKRTVKLKIYPVADTPDEKKQSWKRIQQISENAWRAANWIASGQYINDQLIRRIYARKKIDPTDIEAVNQIEKEIFSKEGFFHTKRQASTERDVKEKFPELPSSITNPLNQVVFASYKSDKPDLLAGYRSLRTYRRGMPVTTTKASIKFTMINGNHQILWKLSKSEKIRFSIIYGQDKANNYLTIQRIIDSEIDFSAPQIQLKGRDLFLLLPLREPVLQTTLKKEISVGVDLGIVIPAYIAINDGPQRQAIGNKDDFFRIRTQMQYRRRKLQQSIKSARGGQGRGRKLKALNRLKDKERQFARSYNHMISKKIVDFALKNRAGSIKLELLEGFSKDKRDNVILRNWSYFELQVLIEQKAQRKGIKVFKIDPYRTSKTCSACGHYEIGQREMQSKFVCAVCGLSINADYNAALNIARSSNIVKKKEDCEYYKNTAGPTAEG